MSNISTLQIYTHMNVDLDNTVSTIVFCLINKVPFDTDHIHFVPANQLDFPKDAVCIDMQINKHAKDSSAVKDLCSNLLPREIVDAITMGDATGRMDSDIRMLINGIHKMNWRDIDIVRYFVPFVQAWFILQSERESSEAVFHKLKQVQLGKYKFLIVEHHQAPFSVRHWALKENIVGKIYIDKYDMGIMRYPQYTSPDFTKLPRLEGFFVHENGFLYASGTRKAPAKRFPPDFTNLHEFIVWLQVQFKLLGDQI